MTDPPDLDRERERNRGVAIQVWKREGIILPGHTNTVSRWRRKNRSQEDRQ